MTRPGKGIRSDMGWSSTDRIIVKGMDLPGKLLGKINLGDMTFLELTGQLPTPQQSVVFNAMLVTLVEHGLTPQTIAARLIYLCSPEALQAAVAAGLCGVGSVFAGGSEGTARLLQEALPKDPQADLAAVARTVVADFQSRRAIIPGIGHPRHKPIDPRTPCLFDLAAANQLRGRYVALLESIALEAERAYQRSLPINATGAIGALCCELGFDWKMARGIAVIGRAIGLVGHLAEEIRHPIAQEISRRSEEEASAHARTKEVRKMP
jgi:citrate synthase